MTVVITAVMVNDHHGIVSRFHVDGCGTDDGWRNGGHNGLGMDGLLDGT